MPHPLKRDEDDCPRRMTTISDDALFCQSVSQIRHSLCSADNDECIADEDLETVSTILAKLTSKDFQMMSTSSWSSKEIEAMTKIFQNALRLDPVSKNTIEKGSRPKL